MVMVASLAAAVAINSKVKTTVGWAANRQLLAILYSSRVVLCAVHT